MKTNIEAKFKLIEILNISPVELSYIKDLTIPENIVSELLNGESGALKVHLENIRFFVKFGGTSSIVNK